MFVRIEEILRGVKNLLSDRMTEDDKKILDVLPARTLVVSDTMKEGAYEHLSPAVQKTSLLAVKNYPSGMVNPVLIDNSAVLALVTQALERIEEGGKAIHSRNLRIEGFLGVISERDQEIRVLQRRARIQKRIRSQQAKRVLKQRKIRRKKQI